MTLHLLLFSQIRYPLLFDDRVSGTQAFSSYPGLAIRYLHVHLVRIRYIKNYHPATLSLHPTFVGPFCFLFSVQYHQKHKRGIFECMDTVFSGYGRTVGLW